MSIQFTTIPSSIRVPLFYNEFAPPVGIGGSNLRTLLIGQTINVLSAVPILAPSLDYVKQLCGAGSQLAQMMFAFRKNDPLGEVWILPLADAGSSVAATGTIVLSGTATAASALALYIADEPVPVAVAVAQTAAALATAVAAAINALTNLPVTASATTATVTLTAKNKGTLGNDIDIRLNYYGAPSGEFTPAGITATITAMASGATDPDLATPLLALNSLPFEVICHPFATTADLTETTAFMSNVNGRWSYGQMLFGHAVTSKRGAGSSKSAAVAALQTFGTGLNDAHLTCFGFYDKPSPVWKDAAAHAGAIIGAVRADNAPPPLQTVPIFGLKAPPPASQLSLSDQQLLLTSGIALDSYGADLSTQILRAITTYQTDAYGQADASYLDCETMFALAAFVRFIRQRLQTKFARCKLAKDGTNFGAGSSAIVTPNIARAEILSCYQEMIDLGWVEDMDTFSAGLVVQINPTDPTRLDMLLPPNVIPGLHVLASQTQLNLGG